MVDNLKMSFDTITMAPYECTPILVHHSAIHNRLWQFT